MAQCQHVAARVSHWLPHSCSLVKAKGEHTSQPTAVGASATGGASGGDLAVKSPAQAAKSASGDVVRTPASAGAVTRGATSAAKAKAQPKPVTSAPRPVKKQRLSVTPKKLPEHVLNNSQCSVCRVRVVLHGYRWWAAALSELFGHRKRASCCCAMGARVHFTCSA